MLLRASLLRVVTLSLLAGSFLLQAQQPSQPAPEPEYLYEFAALNPDGALIPLEKEKLTRKAESHNRFVYVSGTSEETVPNDHSPVRLPGNASFVIKMASGAQTMDPSTIVTLKPFVIQKDLRALPEHSGKAVMFAGTHSQAAPDTSIPLSFKKYGQSSILITPTKPLPPGEYVLEANSGFSGVSCFGVDAGLASSTPTINSAPAAQSASPASWQVKSPSKPDAFNTTQQAILRGTSEADGQQGAALLTVSCHTNTQAGFDAQPTAVLRVRRGMIDFGSDGLDCEGDGNLGNTFLHSQQGSAPPQQGSLCYSGDLPPNKTDIVDMDLAFDHAADWFKTLRESGGEPLYLKIRVANASQDNLSVTFHLPVDGAAVTAMLAPCVSFLEDQKRKSDAAMVVSCPSVTGAGLSDVEVLTGPSMRKLAPDPDNDIGSAWILPKATKAHPVRARFMLACSYKSSGDATASAEPTRKLLPIPAVAASCMFREDNATDGLYGVCSR